MKDFTIEGSIFAKYTGNSSTVRIPDGITEIGAHAFEGNTTLSAVVIPGSVQTICADAFKGCTALETISFPEGVAAIETSAFRGCTSITSILLPRSVTKLGDGAFASMSAIASLQVAEGNQVYYSVDNCIIERATGKLIVGCQNSKIPDVVTEIDLGAFEGCTELTAIDIPGSVTTIHPYAFSGCTALTSLTIRNGVRRILTAAFRGCKGITSVWIPESVEKLEGLAFGLIPDLVSLQVAEGNQVYYSVDNCIIERATGKLIVGCQNSKIPDGVTEIGDWAFKGRTTLTSLTLPDTVTAIGWGAFSGCEALASMNIPDSIVRVQRFAFSGCTAFPNLHKHDGGLYLASVNNPYHTLIEVEDKSRNTLAIHPSTRVIADFAFYGCKYTGEFVIPNGIKTIGVCAVSASSGISGIVVPASVEQIYDGFANISTLVSLQVAEDNRVYRSVDNCIIERATGKLIVGCQSSKIPEGVTVIGERAFSDCTGLREITIPDSVTQICDFAFSWCSALAPITIPDSVQVLSDKAFFQCKDIQICDAAGKRLEVDPKSGYLL